MAGKGRVPKEDVQAMADVAVERVIKTVSKKEPRRNVTLSLDASKYSKLQKVCNAQEWSLSGLVDLLIKSFLDEYDGWKGKTEQDF